MIDSLHRSTNALRSANQLLGLVDEAYIMEKSEGSREVTTELLRLLGWGFGEWHCSLGASQVREGGWLCQNTRWLRCDDRIIIILI